jgi:hypothetical protein
MNRNSFQGKNKKFLSTPHPPDRLWSAPILSGDVKRIQVLKLATPLILLRRWWLFKHRKNFTNNIIPLFIPVSAKGIRIVNNGMKINFSNASLIYSYNKSQRDALFLNFILVKNSTYFGQIYCPSSGVLSTVFTAIDICHTSSVDCLLARWGWNWPR